MKILVIGGMHGNEPLGPEVVKLLRDQKITNVDTLIANEEAIVKDVRFVAQDLNRSFPGDSSGKDYEIKRAAEVLQACKGYDLVLDFHNTHCPQNDCVFVGDTAGQLLYDAAAVLNLRRVVVADYECLNKYAPNCMSIEISLDSPLMDARYWVEKITDLAKVSKLDRGQDLELYRFVYRITLDDRDRLRLANKNLRAFEQLDTNLAKAMGVVVPAFPIFIADAYTPYNYGGLLVKKVYNGG